MTRKFLFSVLVVAVAARLQAQAPLKGAKDLFYDPAQGTVTSVTPAPAAPSKKPDAKGFVHRPSPVRLDSSGRRPINPASDRDRQGGSVGLSYWIELQGPQGGPGSQVANGRIFRSGERIRLHFRSNVEGNIALIQLGSSGTSQVLFPNPGLKLTDSRLLADEDRILPSEGSWLRFDDNPGVERLIVMFARRPGDLDRFAKSPTLGAQETGSLVQTVQRVKGSKDLLVETDSQTVGEVGTYAVNVVGQPVVLEIVLEHR
jgi:hypothetical protein